MCIYFVDAIRKEKGLHQVVATMKIGEICHAWVSPEYGYGAEGNFSFPSIPPGATLSYSIQLIDFESPKSGDGSDSLGFLTYEERLEAAKRRRLEGNDLYSSGQLQHAMGKYESALAFLDEDFMMQLYEFHYDKAMEERVNVLLNVSACRLKQEKYHQVIEVTTQVISHDGSHIKALYRRGMARRKLGQTAAALEDLEQAKCISEKASPDGRADVAILREIVSARKDLQDQSRAQGVLYKNMIRSAVDTIPRDHLSSNVKTNRQPPVQEHVGVVRFLRHCISRWFLWLVTLLQCSCGKKRRQESAKNE